jgi:hypothetical protein
MQKKESWAAGRLVAEATSPVTGESVLLHFGDTNCVCGAELVNCRRPSMSIC